MLMSKKNKYKNELVFEFEKKIIRQIYFDYEF